jgi:CheY-like chemotaxis protein
LKSPLRILHLEDDPDEAALVEATLEAEGIICTVTCVRDRDDLVATLECGGIDLIISDFTLSAFDGLSVIPAVRTRWPGLPIILISATPGEELASLRSGATDHVLKGHLSRLAPAVRRAMQGVEERTGRRRLEAQITEARKLERLASGVAHDFNNILTVIISYNDLIASEVSLESPLRVYTEEIRQASERAAGLTKQLLIVSRGSERVIG